MALTTNQYDSLKRTFRAMLSGNRYEINPRVSESTLFSFISTLLTAASGRPTLTAHQIDALDAVLRSQLADSTFGIPNAPSVTNLVDFFAQLSIDSAGAVALVQSQYAVLFDVLRASLSDDTSEFPQVLSDGAVLSYIMSYHNAIAPALFQGGQSNSGNQDGTPGTTDVRVSLSWSSASLPTITGPAPMALQAGGHSFEWQCSTNMAAAFSSNILVSKYWADGTMIEQWLPYLYGGTLWTGLAKALEELALRCLAAGVTQIEFGWCQGESNTPNNQTASLATFQQYTNELFDSIKYLLDGFGLTVHFTIQKTNAGITTGPNPSDVSASSLASIRGFQDALAIARSDTSIIDFASTGGNIHYIGGQTNTAGALWNAAIVGRYTGAQPGLTTPPTVENIMSSAVLLDWDSRSITGLTDGAAVDLWPDIGPGVHHGMQTGSARPLFKINALGSIPEVEFDGTDDKMPVPGVTLPAPGTTPTLSLLVARQKSYTFGDRLWGGNANFCGCYQGDVSGSITATNASSSAGQASGIAPGASSAFMKVENFFSNAAGDYQRLIDALLTTGTLGNTAPGSVALASANGGSYSNIGAVKWVLLNRQMTKIERDKMRGFGAKNYGLSVWGSV